MGGNSALGLFVQCDRNVICCLSWIRMIGLPNNSIGMFVRYDRNGINV